MAKKKTNFISYELDNLEKYLKQLQGYLDDNPPDALQDRVEMMTSTNGNPILKVIASKEAQLKAFSDILMKLPNMYAELNTLRKAVNDEQVEISTRGGSTLPGFMQIASSAIQDVTEDKTTNHTNDEFVEEKFEDDEIIISTTPEEKIVSDEVIEVVEIIEYQKQLPSSSIPTEDVEDDWSNEDY